MTWLVFLEKVNASISRELSKIYKENIRGTLKELYDEFENKNVRRVCNSYRW